MKNKHPKFYQKFLETINITSVPIETPKEYDSSSSSVSQRRLKKRGKKEEEKKSEEDVPLSHSKTLHSLRKKK